MNKPAILIYESPSGKIKLDVRLKDKTVWLTQADMVQLFQSPKQNKSRHIRSIYEERELLPEATVKKYLTVRQEGNRSLQRELEDEMKAIANISEQTKKQVSKRKQG